MPDFILEALNNSALIEAYNNRPPYQQNDYIGWIMNTKLKVTKEKRLNQMLSELKTGGIYMKMKHNPSKK